MHEFAEDDLIGWRFFAAGWTVDERGWDGDLGRLNLGLAASGVRFSQPVRINTLKHVNSVKGRQ